MRKSIYELLVREGADVDSYEGKIKSLKAKYPDIDEIYIGILSHIQQMTSEKVHEQSWDRWDATSLRLIIGTLRSVLYEIYVRPAEKRERAKNIQELLPKVKRAGPS